MKRRHLGERLSALIDGELSAARRDRVLAHLARCEACRQEAVALRLLKRRMYALGDAAADDALTWRLLALAPTGEGRSAGRRPGSLGWPLRGRRRRRAWSLVAAGVAVAGLSLSTAAFVAGGDRPAPPGPRVVPAVDVFLVQHAINTGQLPIQPSAAPAPLVSSGAP